jgi:hypothetical protein
MSVRGTDLTRAEVETLVGVGGITPETPCRCGAEQPCHYCPVQASAKKKLRAALDSVPITIEGRQ